MITNPAVVLVKSIYPSNIGASSRAMVNMGVSKMILVSPACEIDYSAQQAAATGQAPLQNRIVYKSWAEFYKSEKEGLRISLTARDGRNRAVKDLQTTLETIKKEFEDSEPRPLYFFFGPEDCGLSDEDIKLSHHCCNIPTYSENPSLNLAQAVLLSLYIFRNVFGGDKTILDGQHNFGAPKPVENETVYFPEQTLRSWLLTLGFDLSKEKVNAYTTLKRMLLHNSPTPKELRTFESIVQQTIRKLKK